MSDYLLVICALLGVIGLIFLTYYATKWLNKKFRNVGYNGSHNGIKIVECLGIAQDKQLIAVRVGKKAMLLGVTPSTVTKLSDLDEEDMSILEQPQELSGSSFMDNLKNAFANKNNSTESTSANGDYKQEDNYGKNENDDF